MKAAVYVRVSTVDQTVENQRADLLRLCEARGWSPQVFQEIESGAKVRPVLDSLCADAKRGRFGVVVVWALDRLGRSLWDTLDRVRGLDAAGVRLVSYQEPWADTGTPTRDLLLMIFAWVAQQERQRLIERTKAGLARARAQGKRIGRPGRDVTASQMARARGLREAGRPWRDVARAVKVPVRTLRRRLEPHPSRPRQSAGNSTGTPISAG